MKMSGEGRNGMMVNNDLENIWKGVVLACYSAILLRGSEESGV
jgi:hypothetical protein